MDVNIRLTIEPAAFFNVSLADRTATKLQVVRAKGSNRNSLPLPLPLLLSLSLSLPPSSLLTLSLSLSLRMLRERCSREKRPRIANVSTARITRAPADRKLPLIASQTFILHPEYPRLLLYPLPIFSVF